MSKLRKSARGMPCTLQLECCNHNCETTVLAHIRLGFNAGIGQKPPDHHALFACSDCHDAIDGRTKDYWDFDFLPSLKRGDSRYRYREFPNSTRFAYAD